MPAPATSPIKKASTLSKKGSTPSPSHAHPHGDLSFLSRHIGPSISTQKQMLAELGLSSLEDLVQATLPPGLASAHAPNLPPARSETRALADLEKILATNQPFRSLIGLSRHHHPTRPPSRHHRGPWLVHFLYPLPTRNLSRPLGSSSKLSNDDPGADWNGNCQRIPPRRRHRRR